MPQVLTIPGWHLQSRAGAIAAGKALREVSNIDKWKHKDKWQINGRGCIDFLDCVLQPTPNDTDAGTDKRIATLLPFYEERKFISSECWYQLVIKVKINTSNLHSRT